MYDTGGSGTYNHVTPIADHLRKISTSIARTVYSLLLNDSAGVEVVKSSNLTVRSCFFFVIKLYLIVLISCVLNHTVVFLYYLRSCF